MDKKQVGIIDIDSYRISAILGEKGVNNTFFVKKKGCKIFLLSYNNLFYNHNFYVKYLLIDENIYNEYCIKFI